MQNYVISLKTSIERRKHIQKEFDQQNIDYIFFDALTPNLAQEFAENMSLNVREEFLSNGELACFMSHVSIWKKMIDENIPYLAIFEDDVYLGDNSAQFLNDTKWIKYDWNIIKIEAFASKVFLDKKFESIGDGKRKIVQLKGKNLGTAGYILSLAGAKAYLDYVCRIQLIALDQVMFDQYIFEKINPIYQMTPALCIQEMMLYPEKKTVLSSDLLAERKLRMKKYKKKGWKKIELEIIRFFRQIKYSLIGVKVYFK